MLQIVADDRTAVATAARDIITGDTFEVQAENHNIYGSLSWSFDFTWYSNTIEYGS